MVVKISELLAVVTPADTDEFETNQGGTSKRETRAQITSDAVKRANHTGTQLLATISDAGTAAAANTGDFATAAQGATADTAVQPADLAPYAFLGRIIDRKAGGATPTAAEADNGVTQLFTSGDTYTVDATVAAVEGWQTWLVQDSPSGTVTLAVSGVTLNAGPTATTVQGSAIHVYEDSTGAFYSELIVPELVDIALTQLEDLTEAHVLGRADGAGTGATTQLTGTQVAAIIGGVAAAKPYGLVSDPVTGTGDKVYTNSPSDGGWVLKADFIASAARDYAVVLHDTDTDGTTLTPAAGNLYIVSGSAAPLVVTWDGASFADGLSAVVRKATGGPAINHAAAATYTLNGASSPGTDAQNNADIFVQRIGSDFVAPGLLAATQGEAFQFGSTVGVTGLATLTGGALLGADLAAADNAITRPELTDYSETSTEPSSSSNVLTLDLENGNVFQTTLTEDVTTLTISNPPATGKAGNFTLIVVQGAGPYAISWPAEVLWPGGSAPTLSAGNGDIDVFAFVTRDAGTSWYGFVGGQDFS